MAAVETVERELGPLDILVNNAGWDKLEPFIESTPETWDRIIGINYRAIHNSCKARIPPMQAHGQRKIVALSSHAGRARSLRDPADSACKCPITALSTT